MASKYTLYQKFIEQYLLSTLPLYRCEISPERFQMLYNRTKRNVFCSFIAHSVIKIVYLHNVRSSITQIVFVTWQLTGSSETSQLFTGFCLSSGRASRFWIWFWGRSKAMRAIFELVAQRKCLNMQQSIPFAQTKYLYWTILWNLFACNVNISFNQLFWYFFYFTMILFVLNFQTNREVYIAHIFAIHITVCNENWIFLLYIDTWFYCILALFICRLLQSEYTTFYLLVINCNWY